MASIKKRADKFSYPHMIILFLLIFSCFHSCLAHDKLIIQSIPKCGTHFLQKTITEITEKPTFNNTGTMEENLTEADKEEKILRISCPFNMELANIFSKKGYKLICIYRDPRDALISLVVYMRSFKGEGVKRDFFEVVPNFDSLSFSQQLASVMSSNERQKNYLHYYFARINWHRLPFAYGVKYENLVGSQGGGDDRWQLNEILKIAEYIHTPISLEKGKEIASKIYSSQGKEIIEGKEFVAGKIGSWKKFMNPKHKEHFKLKFGDLLIKLGYEKNDNW
jgi:Sulfotransferase domain